MTKMQAGVVKCRCGRLVQYVHHSTVNIALDPNLKQKVLDRKINHFSCVDCGYQQEMVGPFLYHDMNNRLLVHVLPEHEKRSDGGIPSNVKEGLDLFTKAFGDIYRKEIVYGYDELFGILESRKPVQTQPESVDSLLAYCKENSRVCPIPQKWNELWEMLPDKKRRGNGWEPSLPLILAAWHDTPAISKILRVSEHIKWASEHGRLKEISVFLRSLKEADWFHIGE